MKYRKKGKAITRKVAGEVLLVPIRGSLADMEKLYVLDEVGERIWDSLDEENSLEGIRDIVCSDFEIDASTAEQDIGEYIEALAHADLIEEVV